MTVSTEPILVVDDNPSNRDLLSRRLIRSGYDVDIAEGGSQALEMIGAHNYALVLLDLMMPDVTGQDVLSVVRQEHSLTSLPIIVATAVHDGATIAETLELGANDYVTKPLRFEEVLARVKTQLRIRQMSISGGFHRLGNRSKERASETNIYCPRCTHAIFFDSPQCSFCDRLRPADGWMTRSLTRYRYLGKVFQNRYVVERFIDRGTTGDVYAVRDLDLGRLFAAKVIDTHDKDHTLTSDLRARTHREVEAMLKVQNPYVVKPHEVIDLGQETYAILMDFVHGMALHRILGSLGKIDLYMALDITKQIAQGLYEVHTLGMVHRDIKPANIMLEKLPAGGYFTHILDFGLVHILEEAANHHTKLFCGTPTYSAPELVEGENRATPQADIYSLGAMLFHMITGKVPFEAQEISALFKQHKHTPVPRVGKLLPNLNRDLAAQLDRLISFMMAKEIKRRPENLLVVIAEIDAITSS